jgi:iron-sulfur cluster assembly accessory protein
MSSAMSTKVPINVTERAAMQIVHLIEMRDKPAFGIRIGVSAGGCAGFEYKMEYVDEADCADEIIVYSFAENKTFKYHKNIESEMVNKQSNSEEDEDRGEEGGKEQDSDGYPTKNRLRKVDTKQSLIAKKPRDIKILIGPKAIIYLIGTEVDYIKDKFSSGFTFLNPRQKNTCGCGKSFNT